jgi:hypothetical protein
LQQAAVFVVPLKHCYGARNRDYTNLRVKGPTASLATNKPSFFTSSPRCTFTASKDDAVHLNKKVKPKGKI